jgi:hypothetical protein
MGISDPHRRNAGLINIFTIFFLGAKPEGSLFAYGIPGTWDG